jgi:predicted nucleic acid-binding protein
MLDRLTDVLRRPPLNLSLVLATERSNLIAEMSALSNLPLVDTEDRGVLEAALAGHADYLATYNLEDFAPIAVPDPDTGRLRVRTLQILHPRTLAGEIGLY